MLWAAASLEEILVLSGETLQGEYLWRLKSAIKLLRQHSLPSKRG